MIRFENHVQEIKHKVQKELIRAEINDNLINELLLIPKRIIPGPEANTRCCIYKERAIINERIKHMLYQYDGEVIDMIDIACDECPINRFSVTEACRGCLAHHCMEACPVDAIKIINKRATIDQSKCIECAKCSKVCQFNAISDVRRPCIKACKIGAIDINHQTKKAVIDRKSCINCGECVFKCPFGAIADKSQLLALVRALKQQEHGKKIYGIVAPSIAAQYANVSIEQWHQALKMVGFFEVVEAAAGADIAAVTEAQLLEEELGHKPFVTTSCCPAFVSFIEKKYPEFKENISPAASPMIIMARMIKAQDPEGVVVFIGPCTAKKAESSELSNLPAVDYTISFEELGALIEAYEIDLETLQGEAMTHGSYFGRTFARSGGVTGAIERAIKEQNLSVFLKPVVCSGIQECDKALKMARAGRLQGNFIEGMACEGGCINGPLSLSHQMKNKNEVDSYGKNSQYQCIGDSIKEYDMAGLSLTRNKG
jgi:[FeFe] hydrogenase (group B1/B3)